MGKITIIQCDRCGKKIADIGLNKASPLYRIMYDKCLCDECAFWEDIANNPKDYIMADGYCYLVLPFQNDPPPGAILGSNGKVFYFFTRNSKTIRSNDVWKIGRVPQAYAETLKDNAYIIPRRAYMIFQKRHNKCDSVGCRDRYGCFFYDYRIEYEKGPFNHVSRDYIPGTEQCPTYIPLRWLRNYQESEQND